MAETINCASCGASNQFPENRNSMLCSFCGNAIEKKISVSDNKTQKKLKKSKIIKHDLAFIERDIENLDEIINLYSDTELDKIEFLTVSNNKIKTLKGISKFEEAEYFDFSYNDLTLIDDLPNLHLKMSNSIFFDFSYNKNLTGFSEKVIEQLNKCQNNISRFELQINGLQYFDYESLSKINFNKILEKPTHSSPYFWIGRFHPKIEIPLSLKKIGFERFNLDDNNVMWQLKLTNQKAINEFDKAYNKSINPSFVKLLGNEFSGGKCFIATATMGSYDHPIVLELRFFRDNWILEKTWGEDFVKWYYYYGSKVAKVVEKSFLLKKISYILIVRPLVYLSRILKNNYE